MAQLPTTTNKRKIEETYPLVDFEDLKRSYIINCREQPEISPKPENEDAFDTVNVLIYASQFHIYNLSKELSHSRKILKISSEKQRVAHEATINFYTR